MVKKIKFLLALPLFTPLLLSTLFIFIFSARSLYRHFSFDTHAFDLGIYTQATYLFSQGLNPFSTLINRNIIGDHFGVILLLLSPIYKLFPSPVTLLIIQAIFVSLSSIPIYLIAKDKLKSNLLSFLITLSYLTSTGIISAIHFDFHLATISVLPLSLMLYTWYFKKWKLYWISLFFSVLFKEDIPIFILGLGIFQLLKNQKKLGIFTILFSLISFYLIKFKIMTFFWAGAAGAYNSSILPLTSPIDLLLLLFTNPKIFLDMFFNSPTKIETMDKLYRQFAFLPILSPLSWVTVFPYLYFRFSSVHTHYWETIWHHNANLEPFLAVSAIFALAFFKLPYKPVIILLLFFLFTGHLSPNGPILTTFQLDWKNANQFSYLKDSLSLIPPKIPISAQSSILPHLANREKIYLFPEIRDAQFIILDQNLASYPIQKEELKNRIIELKKSKNYGIEKESGSLIIFKKLE